MQTTFCSTTRPTILARSIASRLSLPLATAVAAIFVATAPTAQAQSFYKSTTAGNVWTGSFWGNNVAGPFTGAWVSGSNAVFVDNGGTALALTGATTNFASITANENVNVTAGGTLGTGGTVATITVATGKNLNFGTQAVSTAAGTGFIKNGDGIWTVAGGTYTGGFTLNAGTIAVGGVNAMGAGGALTINGGTIRSNNTTARDLSGKYTGGITIGGDFALGDVTNNGALTFNNNVALGAATRSITVNSAATFGGIVSGGANVGLTKAGTGGLTLSGANTYGGVTTISAGTLTINTFTNGGVAGSLGMASNASSNLLMMGAGTHTLSYSGGTTTTDRGMTFGALGGNPIISVTNAAANLTLTNVIVGTVGQQIDFTKGGGGTLTLSNDNNSYIGRTFVSGGSLAVTSISAVGAGNSSIGVATNAANGLISIGTGTTTTTLSYIGTGNTTDRNLDLPGTAGGAVIDQSGTGLLKFTGLVGATGVGSKTFTLSGSTLGTGEIVGAIIDNTTTGTTVATAASTASTSLVLGSVVGLTVGNEITGTGIPTSTTISAINAATRTVTLSAAATVANNAVITSSGLVNTTSLTKSGTGTWTLSGANTYTGATTVSAGTLDLGGGTATGSLASPTLTLAGGTLSYTRTGNTTQDFTTTNINSNASQISVVSGNTLNLGTVVRSAGGSFDFSNTGFGTVAALASNNVSGIMPGLTFGNTWAVANGAGVPISGLGSYTLTSVAGTTGANYLDGNIDVDNSAGVIDAAITGNSLRFNSPAANTLTLAAGSNAINAGGILVGSAVGSNLSTITGGTITGAANQNLAIIQNNTSGGLTISSAIVDNTSTSVTKLGAGLLTIDSANTYTGGTTVAAGTLKLSGAGTLGPVAARVAVSSGAVLDLNGTNQSITLAAGSGVGTVANNSGSGTSVLTLTATAVTDVGFLTIADSTSTPGGKVAVVITNNMQIPSNLNTYSGGTTVNAGAFFYLNAATPLGAGTGLISLPASGATTALSSGLLVDGGATYANDVSGAGYVHNNSGAAATTTMTGNLNTSGTFNVRIAGAGFNFAGSGNSTLSGVIGATGASGVFGPNATVAGANVIKSGTGTLTLSGANVYTGTTTISGGILNANTTSALGSGAATNTLIFNGGTLQAGGTITSPSTRMVTLTSTGVIDTNGNAVSFAGAASGAGGLTKNGAGTLTSSVANTFTGPITINGGDVVFSLNVTGAPYASTQININNGATLRITGTTGNQTIYDGRNYTFDSVGGGSVLVSTGNYNAASTPFSITTNGGAANTIGLITTSGAFGFNLGSAVATFDVALGTDANSDLTVTPIIANTGSIVKTGSGRLTLTGANTFSGGTTINGGTLRASGGAALTGLVTLANVAGATLQVVTTEGINGLTGGGATGGTVSIDAGQTFTLASGTQTYSGTISGAGILTNGGAIQTLNGALSHTGGVNVTSGTLTLGSSSNTYTGATVISSARGLIVTANNALGATGTGNETTVTGTGGAAVSGVLGLSGGINYSTTEKIIGSGVGNTAALTGFAIANRGFIQSVSGNNTFAGDIELSGNGLSRIGTQDGAQLTLAGAITQGAGITTANILFRAGGLAGDFVTLSNAGNSFGGDSQVFTGLATPGSYAGVRLGINNGLPTNLTISGFGTTGTSTALDLAGFNQSLNGLITGGSPMSIVNLNTGTPSTLTLNPTVDKTSGNTPILGGGGLGVIDVVKDGALTHTLTSVNTYTGTTTINNGTLLVGVGGSISGSTTTVNTGGTLGGSGTTGPIVLAGGTLAPGLSPGILSSGNATFSGGTAAFEITGVTVGTQYDQLAVGGTVAFTANTALTINLGVFDPADNDAFTLISNNDTDAITLGGFGFTYLGEPLSEGESFFVSAQEFTISYAAGSDLNDVVLTAVPEPGSALILLSGMGMLLGLQRRRRA